MRAENRDQRERSLKQKAELPSVVSRHVFAMNSCRDLLMIPAVPVEPSIFWAIVLPFVFAALIFV